MEGAISTKTSRAETMKPRAEHKAGHESRANFEKTMSALSRVPKTNSYDISVRFSGFNLFPPLPNRHHNLPGHEIESSAQTTAHRINDGAEDVSQAVIGLGIGRGWDFHHRRQEARPVHKPTGA